MRFKRTRRAGSGGAGALGGGAPAPAATTRVVAIGGGTGLPLMLRCLLTLGYRPSALVTMADDGGSSGRLRRELGILPPGDVRNCLAALGAPQHERLSALLSYRFEEGEGITGHALGNLMLAALTDMGGSFEEAVKYLERLLDARGRVLPSTFDDVILSGYDRRGASIDGQESLAKNPIAIADVDLRLTRPQSGRDKHPAPRANPEAVAALKKADLIVIGPGSLYTSIIPNFLVPEIRRALCVSEAPVVYFCNVANMRGETSGYTPLDYVDALVEHGLRGCLDMVVLSSDPPVLTEEGSVSVTATPEVIDELVGRGMMVVSEPLVSAANPFRHDQDATTRALEAVIQRVFYR